MSPARGQKTVLAAEDDPWTRSLLADRLADEGYAVELASNGWSALRLATQRQPDVILLGLVLPERSGLDVLRELKRDQRTRTIPVIVVSGRAAQMVENEPLEADGIMEEPLARADLLRQVERLARASHIAPRSAGPVAASGPDTRSHTESGTPPISKRRRPGGAPTGTEGHRAPIVDRRSGRDGLYHRRAATAGAIPPAASGVNGPHRAGAAATIASAPPAARSG